MIKNERIIDQYKNRERRRDDEDTRAIVGRHVEIQVPIKHRF